MRNPNEIEINGKKLSDIIAANEKFWSGEGGEIANLYGAYLEGANLKGANLYGAYLKGANLYGANLEGANLYGANLEGANLYGANLYGAYLKGANLEGANLKGAYLEGANLKGANLEGANLKGANLEGANLYGAYLYDAKNLIAIGPIGSRCDFIYAVKHENDIMVKTGCFWGTLAQFKTKVKETHNDNEYAQAYGAAVVFIRKYFAAKS